MAVSISLAITQNSQSVANNTSNVTVKVTAKWTYGSYNATGQCTGSITIDGTKYSFTGIKFNTGETTSGSQVIMTKTVDVKHGSDGKKTLSCSASFVTGVGSGTVSCSGSKSLTTIPRKSTLTVANGTLGTALTLTINELASSMVHKITYKCGDVTGYILGSSSATSTSLSVEWTPPLTLAKQNKTGTSVSITFYLYTYNGSTSLGTNTYTKTFSIPSSVKPTISLSVVDSMKYADTYGAYIQGMSKFKVVVTATSSQSETIKSYKTTVDGKTYTNASFTTGAISGNGEMTISTSVTDSRGRTSTASKKVNVVTYSKPKITSLKVFRSDANGNPKSSGAYLTVSFGYSITSLNDKNKATITVEYKKSFETSYSLGTVANNKCIFEADPSSTYDILLTISDDFYPVTKTATGSSISKVFSWLSNVSNNVKTYGFAFGKVAELVGYLDVAFKTLFRDHAYFENNKVIYGTKPNTDTRWEAFNPVNAYGNTVIGYDNFNNGKGQKDLKDSQTNIYGYDLLLGVANVSSQDGTTYRPYRRRGDSITLTFRGSGYVTNSKKDVSFWIPFAAPIVGSPTVTAKSGDGFVFRQGDNYTHGSSATVHVKPSSYEAASTPFNGVYIKAVFSDTTNAINNDTIGIYWNGTIEFS